MGLFWLEWRQGLGPCPLTLMEALEGLFDVHLETLALICVVQNWLEVCDLLSLMDISSKRSLTSSLFQYVPAHWVSVTPVCRDHILLDHFSTPFSFPGQAFALSCLSKYLSNGHWNLLVKFMFGRVGSVIFGCGLLRVCFFLTFQVWFLSSGVLWHCTRHLQAQVLHGGTAVLPYLAPLEGIGICHSCKVALLQASFPCLIGFAEPHVS